jgi:hypothetical protein
MVVKHYDEVRECELPAGLKTKWTNTAEHPYQIDSEKVGFSTSRRGDKAVIISFYILFLTAIMITIQKSI